jgi:hypothetical protein
VITYLTHLRQTTARGAFLGFVLPSRRFHDDVQHVVFKQFLGVRLASSAADGAVWSLILMDPRNLSSAVVAVCEYLAASADRFARQRRAWVSGFFKRLVEAAFPGPHAMPVAALVETVAKLLLADDLDVRFRAFH